MTTKERRERCAKCGALADVMSAACSRSVCLACVGLDVAACLACDASATRASWAVRDALEALAAPPESARLRALGFETGRPARRLRVALVVDAHDATAALSVPA